MAPFPAVRTVTLELLLRLELADLALDFALGLLAALAGRLVLEPAVVLLVPDLAADAARARELRVLATVLAFAVFALAAALALEQGANVHRLHASRVANNREATRIKLSTAAQVVIQERSHLREARADDADV